MKIQFSRFNDSIITKRWFSLVSNSISIIIISCTMIGFGFPDHPVSVIIGSFSIGFIVASTMHVLVMPKLFEDYNKAQGDVLRAQIERELQNAYADFKKQHPEAEMAFGPVVSTRN